MASLVSAEGLRFLYRTEEGVIGRKVWWLGVLPLASLAIALTAGWIVLDPYARRGLDERAFLDPMTIFAYVYLGLYAFATILIAVCFVVLSMKRLRDRGRPPALAGAPPLAALLAGSAAWLEPQVGGAVVPVLAMLANGFLVAVFAWAIVEMGVLRGDSA